MATLLMAAIHTLRSAELESAWAPGVGMVGCSLHHRGEELLGQRDGLEGYAERGSTFGIPFLHPWANRVSRVPAEVPQLKREEHGLAIHGELTAWPGWDVLEASEERLHAGLDFPEELLPAFPYPHRVELDVRLEGARLSVATTVQATQDVAVPVSFGFHPYFALPGLPREAWEIELPVRRRAVLDERMLPTGEHEEMTPIAGPLGDQQFDDCYDALEPGRPFVLSGGDRRIEVSFDEGYPIAQVYAPSGSPFICFEPMTAPIDALNTGDRLRRLQPGEEFRAAWSLSYSA